MSVTSDLGKSVYFLICKSLQLTVLNIHTLEISNDNFATPELWYYSHAMPLYYVPFRLACRAHSDKFWINMTWSNPQQSNTPRTCTSRITVTTDDCSLHWLDDLWPTVRLCVDVGDIWMRVLRPSQLGIRARLYHGLEKCGSDVCLVTSVSKRWKKKAMLGTSIKGQSLPKWIVFLQENFTTENQPTIKSRQKALTYLLLSTTTSSSILLVASKEISHLLWKHKLILYPPLYPIPSQMTAIRTHNLTWSISILSFHVCLDLQSGLFPLGFPTTTFFWFVICCWCHMPMLRNKCMFYAYAVICLEARLLRTELLLWQCTLLTET